jgi:hypothetical protein
VGIHDSGINMTQ